MLSNVNTCLCIELTGTVMLDTSTCLDELTGTNKSPLQQMYLAILGIYTVPSNADISGVDRICTQPPNCRRFKVQRAVGHPMASPLQSLSMFLLLFIFLFSADPWKPSLLLPSLTLTPEWLL